MRYILFFLPILFIACTATKDAAVDNSSAPSMQALFLLLPDEAFYLNDDQSIFSKEERPIILQSTTKQQAASFSSNFHVYTSSSSSTFLELHSLNDDGIQVCLKTWEREDKSIVVGVNISVGDMCCEYSQLKLFYYTDAVFIDVTETLFPKLEIEDFVVDEVDAEIKALLPSPIDLNIYTYPQNDTIELSIDYTPMLYDLVTSYDLENELRTIDQRLKLVWQDDGFVLHKD